MKKPNDLTGEIFGKLTATKLADKVNGRVHWLCGCECGGSISVNAGNLKRGSTTSCGCLRGKKKIAEVKVVSYPGIKLKPNGKWSAIVYFNNKGHSCGTHNTQIEALTAQNSKRKELTND